MSMAPRSNAMAPCAVQRTLCTQMHSWMPETPPLKACLRFAIPIAARMNFNAVLIKRILKSILIKWNISILLYLCGTQSEAHAFLYPCAVSEQAKWILESKLLSLPFFLGGGVLTTQNSSAKQQKRNGSSIDPNQLKQIEKIIQCCAMPLLHWMWHIDFLQSTGTKFFEPQWLFTLMPRTSVLDQSGCRFSLCWVWAIILTWS